MQFWWRPVLVTVGFCFAVWEYDEDYTRTFFGFNQLNPGSASCIPQNEEFRPAWYRYYGENNYDLFGRSCLNWLDVRRAFKKYPANFNSSFKGFPYKHMFVVHNFCRNFHGQEQEILDTEMNYNHIDFERADDPFYRNLSKVVPSACLPLCERFEAIVLDRYATDAIDPDPQNNKTVADIDPGFRNQSVSGKACISWQRFFHHASSPPELLLWVRERSKYLPVYRSCRNYKPAGAPKYELGPLCFISGYSTLAVYEHCYMSQIDVDIKMRNCFNKTDVDYYQRNVYRGLQSRTISGKECMNWSNFSKGSELTDRYGMYLSTCQCPNVTFLSDTVANITERDDCQYGPWCFTSLGQQPVWEPCFMSCSSIKAEKLNCISEDEETSYVGTRNYTFNGDYCLPWNSTKDYEDVASTLGVINTSYCWLLPKQYGLTFPSCLLNNSGVVRPVKCFDHYCEPLGVSGVKEICIGETDNIMLKKAFKAERKRMTVDRQVCTKWTEELLRFVLSERKKKYRIVDNSNVCIHIDNWKYGPWCVPIKRAPGSPLRQPCYLPCVNFTEIIREEPFCQPKHDRMLSYVGKRCVTVLGQVCLNWKDVTETWLPDDWKALAPVINDTLKHLEKNYCRNPGSVVWDFGAWCFAASKASGGIQPTPCFERCADYNTHCYADTEDKQSSDYRGAKDVTASGHPCIHPDEQKFHYCKTTNPLIGPECTIDQKKLSQEVLNALQLPPNAKQPCFRFCEDFLGADEETLAIRRRNEFLNMLDSEPSSEPVLLSYEDLHLKKKHDLFYLKEKQRFAMQDVVQKDPLLLAIHTVTVTVVFGMICLLFFFCIGISLWTVITNLFGFIWHWMIVCWYIIKGCFQREQEQQEDNETKKRE